MSLVSQGHYTEQVNHPIHNLPTWKLKPVKMWIYYGQHIYLFRKTDFLQFTWQIHVLKLSDLQSWKSTYVNLFCQIVLNSEIQLYLSLHRGAVWISSLSICGGGAWDWLWNDRSERAQSHPTQLCCHKQNLTKWLPLRSSHSHKRITRPPTKSQISPLFCITSISLGYEISHIWERKKTTMHHYTR